MLRRLGPLDRPPPPAYRVPWRVRFLDVRTVIAVNESADTLAHVVITLLASGELLTPRARMLAPGDGVMFRFPLSASLEHDVALLAWRVHDAEYLYRVAR